MELDSCYQFIRAKGLCQIIIRAIIKSSYLVYILSFC